MKQVDFFFDFSSPFAYLGATQIDALAARHGAEVRYRPFLLGALFKSIGTANIPLFTMSDAKRRHAAADLLRWADLYGVPFRFPSRFPMNTVKPLRVVIAAPEALRVPLVHAIFRAYWADDRDISDDATLGAIASGVGADAAGLLAATGDPAVKERLRVATEEAVSAGVCGAPSFLVGDPPMLFWGQDRLMLVEKVLDGWRPAGE